MASLSIDSFKFINYFQSEIQCSVQNLIHCEKMLRCCTVCNIFRTWDQKFVYYFVCEQKRSANQLYSIIECQLYCVRVAIFFRLSFSAAIRLLIKGLISYVFMHIYTILCIQNSANGLIFQHILTKELCNRLETLIYKETILLVTVWRFLFCNTA